MTSHDAAVLITAFLRDGQIPIRHTDSRRTRDAARNLVRRGLLECVQCATEYRLTRTGIDALRAAGVIGDTLAPLALSEDRLNEG